MTYYCVEDNKQPDCRTWDQCHHRGVCLATPRNPLHAILKRPGRVRLEFHRSRWVPGEANSWEVFLVHQGRRVFVQRLRGANFPVPVDTDRFLTLVGLKLDQIARGVA